MIKVNGSLLEQQPTSGERHFGFLSGKAHFFRMFVIRFATPRKLAG